MGKLRIKHSDPLVELSSVILLQNVIMYFIVGKKEYFYLSCQIVL